MLWEGREDERLIEGERRRVEWGGNWECIILFGHLLTHQGSTRGSEPC